MQTPKTTIYIPEQIEDDLGTGIRLYSSEDEIYEARNDDKLQTRIFPSGIDWQATVRYPIERGDDLEEPFTVFKQLQDTIQCMYNADLAKNAYEFNEDIREGDVSRVEDGNVTLRYNDDDQIDVPSSTTVASLFGALLGPYASTGAGLLGFLAAAPGGAPIALGAIFGGLVGTMGGVVTEAMMKDKIGTEGPGWRLARYLDERGQEQYRDATQLDDSLIDRVNEMNRIETEMQVENMIDNAEQFNELEDDEVRDTFDTIMDITFDKAERLRGVTATYETGSYEEAAGFVTTAQDVDNPPERPSIYQEPATFSAIMDRLPQTDHQILAANAAQHPETHAQVEALIDQKYGEAIETVIDEELQGAIG